jgi:hypothetical protein
MKDKGLTLGDLKFIARKREFWASLGIALAVGVLIGVGLGLVLPEVF